MSEVLYLITEHAGEYDFRTEKPVDWSFDESEALEKGLKKAQQAECVDGEGCFSMNDFMLPHSYLVWEVRDGDSKVIKGFQVQQESTNVLSDSEVYNRFVAG